MRVQIPLLAPQLPIHISAARITFRILPGAKTTAIFVTLSAKLSISGRTVFDWIGSLPAKAFQIKNLEIGGEVAYGLLVVLKFWEL